MLLFKALFERHLDQAGRGGSKFEIVAWLTNNFQKDFMVNMEEYLKPLMILNRLHSENHIELTIWGNSPVNDSRALLVEYLLKDEVPVIGMQHGATYGIQDVGASHFDCDFDCCTDFLTYGFNASDLRQTYPERRVSCKIIPVGTTKEYDMRTLGNRKRKKRVDIVYVPDIIRSVTLDVNWEKPHIRSDCARKILKTLDEFKELKVVVKPMVGWSDKNCSVIELMKSLKHIKILKHITLMEFFRKYDVGAAVLDKPGTALLEMIGLDVEIFLKLSPSLFPFNKDALHLLKKRAHCFENVGDLLEDLRSWNGGRLHSLRNREFYQKHVYRENSKEIILKTIEKRVNGVRGS